MPHQAIVETEQVSSAAFRPNGHWPTMQWHTVSATALLPQGQHSFTCPTCPALEVKSSQPLFLSSSLLTDTGQYFPLDRPD